MSPDPASARPTAAGAMKPPHRARHGRRAAGSRGKGGYGMSLNLTPMIDIVFLLLFFFLAASRFQSAEGTLAARLPSRGPVAVEVPRTPIRVHLASEPGPLNTASVRATVDRHGDEPLAMSRLTDVLAELRAGAVGFDADTPVHLIAGEDLAWDHVVNGYNAALSAGFRRIYFVTAAP